MVTQSIADDGIRDTLKSVFGYSSFRPLQEEIVRSILDRKDVLVLMPTGGGKSLCYQLPALMRDGVTVVVSPLIALMKDQVDAMRALGVAATYINSTLDLDEVQRRQNAVVQGRLKLLYVAPERLMLPGFLRLLASTEVAGFAIDEAHCISEWGHDFRPEYRELARLRELFPQAPLGAFTATATTRVQTDIRNQLGLRRAPLFHGSFNRPNLFYEVRSKGPGSFEDLVRYLRERAGASGIIYCASRNGTEDLAERLRRAGFRALAYHAGLTGEERHRRQENFVRDDIDIIVATIAFGMGIDKPDVRFVIHYDLPKTLEGYYQESGRAGRDGERSDCILYFTPGDIVKQQHFAQQRATEEEQRIALWQLRQMADWADSQVCRRKSLLAYFDEAFDGQEDVCCDICRTPPEQVDATVPAQMLLSCIKRTNEYFGAAHLIDILRGSRSQKVLDRRHDQLSTYGIGRDRSVEEWRHITRELTRAGYIRQNPDRYSALEVTEAGRRVLFEGEMVHIAKRREAPVATAEVDTPNAALFERLRALRKRLANERGVPPYVIFQDITLRVMAARLPRTPDDLLRVPGVGQRKALDFGSTFLDEVAAYVDETGAEPQSIPEDPAPRRTRDKLNATTRDTISMFQQGLDIEAIAAHRGLKPLTVEMHLAEAVEAGESIDLARLVTPEKRQAIETVMRETGVGFLGPIKERLGDDYTYGELRLVRAALRAGQPAG